MAVVCRTVLSIPCLNHVHIDPSALVTLGRCMCGFDQMLPADLLETHLRLKEQHQGPEPDGAPRIGAQLTSNPVSPHFNSHSTASTRPASPSAEVTVFKALGDLYYNNDTAPVAHAVRQARTHTHTRRGIHHWQPRALCHQRLPAQQHQKGVWRVSYGLLLVPPMCLSLHLGQWHVQCHHST